MINLYFLRYLNYKNIQNRITYLKWSDFIEKSQWWSKDELNDYQWTKVQNLLNHVFDNVPYYKELLNSMGANPGDFKKWDDFKKIPLLTKDIVRERQKDFIPRNINYKKLKYYTTGGSTGQPMGIFQSAELCNIELAFMYQQWRRVGFKDNAKKVILRGEPLGKHKFCHKAKFSNDWVLSSFHISRTNIKEYARILNQIRPDFLHVYPSSLFVLTKLLIESGLKLNFSPTAILCGSEPIYNYQRELFEKTYNSKVYSWLGLAEGTIQAGECEHTTDYHVWPQYSYVELLSDDGMNLVQKEQKGKIIGTSFNNYVFPLIRYESGDLAIYHADHCDSCKRNFPILKDIIGRVQDEVYLVDGTLFPIGPAIFGIHEKMWNQINRIQIVQEKKGEIIIKIDTDQNRKMIFNFMTRIIERRLNDSLKYSFEFTKDIQTTNQGKHRFLIQKVTQIPDIKNHKVKNS
jgi:phenylacetate-CoA ligase